MAVLLSSEPTGEYITNINTTASYRLLRVPFANGAPGTPEPISSGAISVGSVSDNSDQVVLNFAGATLADIAQAQATFGFTIGLDPDASSRLSDPYGNLLNLDTGINNNVDGARAPIERIIMVVADEATPSEDNPNEYIGSFTVTADVDVPTISATSSYTLLRINDDDTESLVPADQVQINTSATQLNREVIVSFATSQNEITITRATQGFTLGVVNNAFSNTRAVGGRLDPRDAAVAERDTDGPQLTVMTSPAEDTSVEGASTISYNMSFVVSADEPVRDIDSTASYILLVEPSTTNEIPLTVTMSAAGVDAMTATVDVDVSIAAIYEDDVEGFTLGYNIATATELTLNDLAGNPPVNMAGDALAAGDRLDSSDQAVALTSSIMVECAAFYPNIGQRQLFVRVTSMSPVNVDGLTLMSGDLGLLATVEQVGTTQRGDRDEQISILRATLPEGSEFTESMLSVSYLSSEPDAMPVEAVCMDSLTANIDEDSFIDIVDSTPFGGDVPTDRNTVASSEQIVDTPSELENYYNREVIIRSLLAGASLASFTYIVADAPSATTPTRATFDSGMSIDNYLGVDTSENTKFFLVPEDSECEEILSAAYVNRLGDVKLDEFCDGINDRIDLATAEVGSARYVWVDVGDDNRLQLSSRDEPIIHDLTIVPEINFSGQSSYLFISPTNKSVTVSAFVGTNGGSADLGVGGYSYDDGYLDRDEDDLTLEESANNSEIISDSYAIARRDGRPELGETILYWLEGNSNVWSPDSTPLSVRSGGYDLSGTMYAIGGNNNIAVRVADPDNLIEQITRIRQILLYEHRNDELIRVSSMVASRTYVVVADIDTNVDLDSVEVAVQMMDGYEIDQSTANVVELRQMLSREDVLRNSEFEFIQLMVDDIDETRLVTVGWDRIAGIEDITVGYPVVAMQPDAYEDTDGDNVPDRADGELIDLYPTSPTRLQVNIPDGQPADHYVRAHDGNFNQLPMFLTPATLRTAADAQLAGEAASSEQYSPTNTNYIYINNDGMWMSSMPAGGPFGVFGVQGVEDSFTYNDAGMVTGISGGTIYVTFPIYLEDITTTPTLYIGKWNQEGRNDQGQMEPRWEEFERMGTTFDEPDEGNEPGEGITYMDTWYVIERDGPPFEPCSQNPLTYQSEHEIMIDDDGNEGGFIESADNCIMLVITDNHPLHDQDGANGRVIDPLYPRMVPFPSPTPIGGPQPPPPPRGGGGAIGSSDVLLLLTALGLLLVAGIVRRRRQSSTPIS